MSKHTCSDITVKCVHCDDTSPQTKTNGLFNNISNL